MFESKVRINYPPSARSTVRDGVRLLENANRIPHRFAPPPVVRAIDGFLRIIFQICILDDHVVARRFLDTATKRSAFAHIAQLQENPHLGPSFLQFSQNLPRAVLRSVVNAEQFDIEADRQNTFDYLAQCESGRIKADPSDSFRNSHPAGGP
jgi:hypothetical protein